MNEDEAVRRLLRMRQGHFRLESGHHGELWIDIETLCLDPEPVRQCAERLAERLRPHGPEVVCGPLVEGAFVALFVAMALRLPFTYSVPQVDPQAAGLYPVRYAIPAASTPHVRGRRVAIVNDAVNAGSAVRATHADLLACGAVPVAIGTLVALGDLGPAWAMQHAVAFETITSMPNPVWTPSECPLCIADVPLSAGSR